MRSLLALARDTRWVHSELEYGEALMMVGASRTARAYLELRGDWNLGGGPCRSTTRGKSLN